VSAQSSLSIEGGVVPFGAIGGASVHLTHAGPDNIDAFWMGVCWDWPGLTLLEMTLSPELQAWAGGAGPDFFLIEEDPIGGSGVTCGAVLSFVGTDPILPGFAGDILVMSYVYPFGGPDVVNLSFCDTLGNPPVTTQLIADTTSIVPGQLGGALFLEAPSTTPFSRGDSDGNGQIDIVDPIRILGYLFLAESLDCFDASDSNDDAAVNLDDVVLLLGHLFSSGAAPAAPYGACGTDSVDALGCASYPSC